jgi:hypothetical protein
MILNDGAAYVKISLEDNGSQKILTAIQSDSLLTTDGKKYLRLKDEEEK